MPQHLFHTLQESAEEQLIWESGGAYEVLKQCQNLQENYLAKAAGENLDSFRQ